MAGRSLPGPSGGNGANDDGGFPMSVDGDWHLTIDSPMGKQNVVIGLTEESGKLTGTLLNKSNNMTTDIFDGSVDGEQLTWKAKLQQINMTLAFTTTVQDNTMSGKVKAGLFGNFKVSGQRD
jgi:hypothetical protein